MTEGLGRGSNHPRNPVGLPTSSSIDQRDLTKYANLTTPYTYQESLVVPSTAPSPESITILVGGDVRQVHDVRVYYRSEAYAHQGRLLRAVRTKPLSDRPIGNTLIEVVRDRESPAD